MPVRLRGATATFALSGLAVVAALGGLGAFALSRLGEAEAIRDARTTTKVLAQGVVEPAITDGILRGEPAAIAALDEVVRTRVLDDTVVRVKLWSQDGLVLYSDEPRLIGMQFAEEGHLDEGFVEGASAEESGDLDSPENTYERGFGKLLEVYLPLQAPSGEQLLFETYQRYDAVASGGRRVWLPFLPAVLGALLLLWLVQIPLAWSMGRRIAAARAEREHLLHSALVSSDLERRRIAADLHDGVVQDLAGVSYSLAALAERTGPADAESASALTDAAEATRQGVRQLRSLIVDVYPPNLQRVGLTAALEDLVAPLDARGIAAELDVQALPALAHDTELLVYRVAQESVRNVLAHSGARTVAVRLTREPEHDVLTVTDDGCGFGADRLEAARDDGHLGLALLDDLARDAGAAITLDSHPGAGTSVRLEVPRR